MGRLIGAAIAVVLLVLVVFVGYRTATFIAPPPPASVQLPDTGAYAIDANAAAQHLSEAVRFRTVTLDNAPTDDRAQFENFQAWMQQTYPAFHAVARREVIDGLSLLYTWQGSDAAQPPMLLLAHQDVVPVGDDTRAAWHQDPFGGLIQNGLIWGRGSLDDKDSLVGLLEAANYLAAHGARPKRTIMLAFGHDEELGGTGARAIAAELQRRGVRAWFVIDEGMAAVARHPLTGGPASLIGISEKGFGTLRVRAVGQPGHSSMPPRDTAVSLLSEAVERIHAMPIDRSIEGGPALDMMRALAPHLSFTNRMALSNEWLFGPLLRQQLVDNAPAQALMGTTVAPTMISGGVRPNVLPMEATAMINFRIHPRDTSASLLQRARQAVAGMHGVSVDWAEPPREASPVSSTTSSSYALIAALSHQMLPQAPVAPALVLGGTDSRSYVGVAENVYRYAPVVMNDDDLERVHGVDERISIENFQRMIRFYIGVMQAGAMG